jgi:hypothetical protein
MDALATEALASLCFAPQWAQNREVFSMSPLQDVHLVPGNVIG